MFKLIFTIKESDISFLTDISQDFGNTARILFLIIDPSGNYRVKIQFETQEAFVKFVSEYFEQ